jgi:hypothetical protein
LIYNELRSKVKIIVDNVENAIIFVLTITKQNNIMTTQILTTKLNDNFKTLVLAKKTQFGINAVTYCNFKQAYKKCEQLLSQGVNCHVIDRGVVKFIKITN